MLKNNLFSSLLLLGFCCVTTDTYADEPDQWQQFRAHKGINELDAQFNEPKAKPEVQVVEKIIEVEKIVEVEKVVIKEVPMEHEHTQATHAPEPEPVVVTDSDSVVTVESDGYVFKLQNCQMSRRNIKCNLSILSVERDGNLGLYSANGSYPSKLFDRNGNEYIPSKISMGNKSNNNFVKNQYIAGVTAKGTINFENIENSTQSIALIDLSYHDYADNKPKHIKFRNVHLNL
jgi:hypothetical protein